MDFKSNFQHHEGEKDHRVLGYELIVFVEDRILTRSVAPIPPTPVPPSPVIASAMTPIVSTAVPIIVVPMTVPTITTIVSAPSTSITVMMAIKISFLVRAELGRVMLNIEEDDEPQN